MWCSNIKRAYVTLKKGQGVVMRWALMQVWFSMPISSALIPAHPLNFGSRQHFDRACLDQPALELHLQLQPQKGQLSTPASTWIKSPSSPPSQQGCCWSANHIASSTFLARRPSLVARFLVAVSVSFQFGSLAVWVSERLASCRHVVCLFY